MMGRSMMSHGRTLETAPASEPLTGDSEPIAGMRGGSDTTGHTH